MQAYVKSHKDCLGRSQNAGAAHAKLHDGGNGASEQQDTGTSTAEGQKLRREILSQLLSKVQSNAASLVEPLLDTGTAHGSAYSSVHVPALPAAYSLRSTLRIDPLRVYLAHVGL